THVIISCFVRSALAHPPLYSFPTRRSSDLSLLLLDPLLKQLFGTGLGAGGGSAIERFVSATIGPLVRDVPSDVAMLRLVLLFIRSEEHTSELPSRENLVCRLLLEQKKQNNN